MEQNHIEIPYTTLQRSEWDEVITHLESEALQAAEEAYAPYSRFQVGVAILLEDGTTVRGSNQENAAYPSGICAERSALYAAGVNHPNLKVDTLLLLAIAEGERIEGISPCGACRQVIAETAHRYDHPYRVILCGSQQATVIANCLTLLPFTFDGADLPK